MFSRNWNVVRCEETDGVAVRNINSPVGEGLLGRFFGKDESDKDMLTFHLLTNSY